MCAAGVPKRPLLSVSRVGCSISQMEKQEKVTSSGLSQQVAELDLEPVVVT